MLLKLSFGISVLVNIGLIYIVIFLLSSNGMGDFTGPDSHEISRVTSPDSLYDVVFTKKIEGGVLGGGIYYQAYIVQKGMNPAPRTQFINAISSDSCEITWETNTCVRFRYKKGHIIDFHSGVIMYYGKGEHTSIYVKLCSE